MSNQNEAADVMSLIFRGDVRLDNIKCYVGDGPLTDAELRDALAAALRQRETNQAEVSEKFNDDARKVDIKAVVASLHG